MSDVARLRASIAREYWSLNEGLSGLAITARHAFIRERQNRIALYHGLLCQHVGTQEATSTVVSIGDSIHEAQTGDHIMTQTSEHTIQIGTLTLAVKDQSFQTGYAIGYQEYTRLYKGKTLSDFDLLSIQLGLFAGVGRTATYKIGVVTGWYAAAFGADLTLVGEQT